MTYSPTPGYPERLAPGHRGKAILAEIQAGTFKSSRHYALRHDLSNQSVARSVRDLLKNGKLIKHEDGRLEVVQ
jgi:hypothetical protein